MSRLHEDDARRSGVSHTEGPQTMNPTGLSEHLIPRRGEPSFHDGS